MAPGFFLKPRDGRVLPANCEGSPTTIDNGLLICTYLGSPIGGLLLLRIAETLLS
jgi:hypothetical protein